MGSASAPSLRLALEPLWNRRWWFLALPLGAALGYVAPISSPRYAASMSLYLRPPVTQVLSKGTPALTLDDRSLATEIEVLTGNEVRAATQRQLGFDPATTAKVRADTDVLDVTVRAATRAEARRAGEVVASVFDENRRARTVAGIEAQINEISARVDALAASIGSAQALAPSSSRDAELELLIGQRQRAIATSDLLRIRATQQSGGVEVVAAPETRALGRLSSHVAYAVLGAIAGLLVGGVLAYLRHRLDGRLRQGDLGWTGQPPLPALLAAVPPGARDLSVAKLVRSQSRAALAMNSLCSTLINGMAETRGSIIQVTSPARRDGRSSLVAGLGTAMVSIGRTVLLVDADITAPRLTSGFLVNAERGLSTLNGAMTLTSVRENVTDILPDGRLGLLAPGRPAPGVDYLLGSSKVRDALKLLQSSYDVIIVDSPPVSEGSDAIMWATIADHSVLVGRRRHTSRRALGEAAGVLRQRGIKPAGVVLVNAWVDGTGCPG